MSTSRNGRAALLMVAVLVVVVAALPRVTAPAGVPEVKQIANPIEQRAEMIRLLTSIDGKLSEVKDALERRK